jgi:hypothetical protein
MVDGKQIVDYQKNIEEYQQMLADFDAMFIGIPGEIDYSKLKTKKEIEAELDHPSSRSSIVNFDVCDKFGFVKQ